MHTWQTFVLPYRHSYFPTDIRTSLQTTRVVLTTPQPVAGRSQTQQAFCLSVSLHPPPLSLSRSGFLWRDAYRNALAQFRVGVSLSQINVHWHSFPPAPHTLACPFCHPKSETEIHVLFEWPMHVQVRSRCLPDRAPNVHNLRNQFFKSDE